MLTPGLLVLLQLLRVLLLLVAVMLILLLHGAQNAAHIGERIYIRQTILKHG